MENSNVDQQAIYLKSMYELSSNKNEYIQNVINLLNMGQLYKTAIEKFLRNINFEYELFKNSDNSYILKKRSDFRRKECREKIESELTNVINKYRSDISNIMINKVNPKLISNELSVSDVNQIIERYGLDYEIDNKIVYRKNGKSPIYEKLSKKLSNNKNNRNNNRNNNSNEDPYTNNLNSSGYLKVNKKSKELPDYRVETSEDGINKIAQGLMCTSKNIGDYKYEISGEYVFNENKQRSACSGESGFVLAKGLTQNDLKDAEIFIRIDITNKRDACSSGRSYEYVPRRLLKW